MSGAQFVKSYGQIAIERPYVKDRNVCILGTVSCERSRRGDLADFKIGQRRFYPLACFLTSCIALRYRAPTSGKTKTVSFTSSKSETVTLDRQLVDLSGFARIGSPEAIFCDV